MFERRRGPYTTRAMPPSGVTIVILIIGALYTYPTQVSATCEARRSDGTCVCRPRSGNLMMMDKSMDGNMGVVTLEVGMKTELVCVSNMNEAMADVICRQFGFEQKVGFGVVKSTVVDISIPKYTTYGHCRGYEECLEECEGHFWHLASKVGLDGNTGSCYEANERAIICSDSPDPDIPVRPTPEVFESDAALSPDTQSGTESPSPPADQPIVSPTVASDNLGPQDQPLFPIIDYDRMAPADAPIPTTTLAPVTDAPRPQATGQPPPSPSPSELTPHESVLLPSSSSPHSYPSASSRGVLGLLTSAIRAISTSPITPTFPTTPFVTKAGRDPTSKVLHKELVVIEESAFDLHPSFDDSDMSRPKSTSYYSARKSRFMAKLGLWPTTTSLLNMDKMKVIPALQLGKDKVEEKDSIPTIASTHSSAPHSSTLAYNLNRPSSSGSTSFPNSFTSSRTMISLLQSTSPSSRFISNRSSASGASPQDGGSGISGDLESEGEVWFGVRNASGAGSEGIASLDRRLDPNLEETSSGSGEGSTTASKAFGTATAVNAEAPVDYLTSVTPTTPINKFRLSGRFVSRVERTTFGPNIQSSIGSSNNPDTPDTPTAPWTISLAESTTMNSLHTRMPRLPTTNGASETEGLSTPRPTETEPSKSVKLTVTISPPDTESEKSPFLSTITPSSSGPTTNHTSKAFTNNYTHSISAITTTISQTLSPTSNSTHIGVGGSSEFSQNKSNVSFPGNTTLSQTIYSSTYTQTSNDQSTTIKISTTSGTTTADLPSESTEYIGFGNTQSLGPHSTVITENSISVLGASTEVVSSTDQSIDTTSSPLRDGSPSPSSSNISPLPSFNPRVSIMPETTAKGSTEILFSSRGASSIDTATSLDASPSGSASEATEGDSSKAFDTVSPPVIPQGSPSGPPVSTSKPTSSPSTGASDSQSTAPATLATKVIEDPTKVAGALGTSTKEDIRSSITSPEAQNPTSKSLVDNLKNPPTVGGVWTSPGTSDTSQSLWSTIPGTLAETEAGGQRQEECDKALTSVELTSPGFPGPYPNDMSCGWNITVLQHEKVVFSIYEFRTAEPDALSIYVGSREGKLIERLSGTSAAPTRRVKRAVRTIDTGVSSVFVVFTSDGDTTESGFRMGYKAKQKTTSQIDHGAATGPEKKKDGTQNRNIIIIVVVIIIVILLVVLLICCKCKCCKKNGEKVVMYDGFGSKTRIVPYESTEEKPRSGSWMGTPSERDPGFHMDESDESPPPPVELQSSSTSAHRGQHTQEGKVKDKSQEVWRSPESGQIGHAEIAGRRRSSPSEDLQVENLTTEVPEVTEDEWVVRDSILMMGEHRPKQPGPKTEGPLDTTIPKKTPPGQEETRISAGRDLSHLYHAGPRDTSPRDNASRRPELLVSVPYASSMYTSRGQAIQMRAARGDPGDPVSGSAASRASPGVGHTSSILAANAKQGTKLPPLRTGRTPTPTESTATDEQKMAAAGQVRATGSRPSSSGSGSSGSRASSAGSQRSNTTYTAGRRTSGSGSPPLTSAPPAEFLCPLTREVMKHPVVFEDGHIYEKSAIQSWCETHDVSPTTSTPIEHGRTRSANELRQRIREWKKSRMQVLITAAQGTHKEPEQIGRVDT